MKKRQKILVSIGIFSVLLSLYLATSTYRYYRIISNYPVTAWTDDHKADCGVVLTGGPNRVMDAIEQLYQRNVKKIIISGVYPGSELRDIFPQKPFYGDLDSDDIILEKRSLTTYGNAQQALPLV